MSSSTSRDGKGSHVETAAMGKVLVQATIENMFDLEKREEGQLSDDRVRRLYVLDALVDTGATLVGMPRAMIDQLGLRQLQKKMAKTPAGPVEFGIFGPVRLTVQDRDCEIRVTELHETCPVLIGFIALEMLDFVVDPKGERLIGNPDHDGKHMIDLY